MRFIFSIAGAAVLLISLLSFVATPFLTGNDLVAIASFVNPFVKKIEVTLVNQKDVPITNEHVTLESTNGIACGHSPCPQNRMEFHGTTNNEGVIVIPENYIQSDAIVNIDKYADVYASSCSNTYGDSDKACVSNKSEWFYENPGYLTGKWGQIKSRVTIKDPRMK